MDRLLTVPQAAALVPKKWTPATSSEGPTTDPSLLMTKGWPAPPASRKF